MLCQRCKKNQATIEYKEAVNGKVFEYHLCPACYQEMFGSLQSANADLLMDLLAPKMQKTEKRCPVCGTTYSEYQRTGLLGCPSCYDAFKTELMPAIERIQGHTAHVGKANMNADKSGYHRKLQELQEQLEAAIRNKEFMKANDIYEQINAINAELSGVKNDGEGGQDEQH
ncbi:MAG: hypothetical protein LUD51_05620 [Clostridia bacterium]|nr:hypothetical protein [Clostridia bacterium]